MVPAGTTLRVGDEQGTLQRPLESSGEATELQAGLEYATFVGGPPLIEAFNAGALDLGYVGDTPPILAQARGQDLVIVGAWRFSGNVAAIVAPPGEELRLGRGPEGQVARLHHRNGAPGVRGPVRWTKVGLTEGDINHVDVPILDVVGTLQSGDVDAAVLVEPILTSYLDSNPGAKVVRDADGLTTGLQLVITTKKTLEDPAKAARSVTSSTARAPCLHLVDPEPGRGSAGVRRRQPDLTGTGEAAAGAQRCAVVRAARRRRHRALAGTGGHLLRGQGHPRPVGRGPTVRRPLQPARGARQQRAPDASPVGAAAQPPRARGADQRPTTPHPTPEPGEPT